MSHSQDHSQKLLSGDKVVPLLTAQGTTEVVHHSFSSIPALGEDCPDSYITHVCIHNEGQLSIGVGQDWGSSEGIF